MTPEDFTALTAHHTAIAESLLVTVFALRPDDGAAGQAWMLSIASTALARAILASLGPRGDAADLLALTNRQVGEIVAAAQAKYFRDQLTIAGGER